MLDRDLAIIYGVETKILKQAVKRNSDRFPEVRGNSFYFPRYRIKLLAAERGIS
jgi:hypothetical protein